MREVLFRGQRTDNKEWVEGYYAVKGKGTDCERHYIVVSTFDSNSNSYPFYFTDVEVDPKTVCQCTGKTDKYKKKIFEGDIVECKARKDGYDKYKVVWCKDYADFRIEPLDFGVRLPIADYEGEYIPGVKYSVIGNIFDNPELIGEQPHAN